MWDKITQVWRIKDIRKNILFVLGILVAFRVIAHIPVPGVNPVTLENFLGDNQVFGLLNIFSGGTLQNVSIAMLGVGPYITASIIFQLLAMIVPSLEEMSKEGESGQQKLNMYTRWLAIPLSFLQSYGMIKLLSSQNIITGLTPLRVLVIMFAVAACTMLLMWFGELISEKKIGNGVSLLIFAGIIASLPSTLQTAFTNLLDGQQTTLILFAVAAILTIVGVVFISEGQRNIPVTYAKQMRGNGATGGSTSHLPFRVNMAGVIPIIFAVSLMLFPTLISQFFVTAKAEWLRNAANGTIHLFQNQTFYNIAYFLLVFGFTFFYTSVIFHPQKIAENLQKQGGFIPGIRPGKETELYLAKTMNRLNLVGALFLGAVAILPLVAQALAGTKSLTIGGTSLLIVVAVAIESAKQIEAQITMHQYNQI